jgi:hypothetical protein
MTEDYCKDLGNRAMLRELSIDLEKEMGAERLAQLGAMEAEVGKLRVANEWGDMGSLMRGRQTLTVQLEEYLKGIETDEDKGVTLDLTGKWRKAAKDLTDNILQQIRGGIWE